MTTEDLRPYIANMRVQIRELSCIANENAMYKSFKLTTKLSQFKELFKADIWPEGLEYDGSIRHVIKLTIMTTRLTIGSYNSQGMGTGRLDYINEVMENIDLLCLQEHWLFGEQMNMLDKTDKNCFVYGISGMNDNCLVLGRPYGGCAIIWKRSLTITCTVTPIDTNSKRVCAVHVKEDVFEFIIFSVYMPCDNNYDGNSMCDFYDTLGCISSICESSGINSYIIGSDLNTDLSRVNSMHIVWQ